MMRLGRRRKLSAPLKVFWSAVFSVLIMAAASIAYLEIYYKADDLVMDEAARDPESTVSVTKIKEGYYFDGPGESTAIIFFSGAKVQEIAYAPLMQRLAERGKDCFLVKVPFRIAFLGTGSADSIMSRYNYPEWYLAGHSMGGVAASSLAANRAEMVSGVILLASYPSAPLSDNFRMLTVYGSEDGCLDRDAYENSRTNWPKDTKEEEIEGGNHAQFGAYGEQKGDGTAQISEKEQWDQTADAIDSWIDEDSSVPEEENDSARALARRSQSKDKSDPTIYKIDSTKRAHNSEAADSGDAAGTDAAAGSDEAAGTDAAVGSQDGSTGTNDTSVPAAPEKKNYTIMIYMVGSNLESRMGSATKDIEEIDEAGLSFDNYNVVLYTGGSMRWISKVPCDCNCVLDMSKEPGDRIVGRTMESANMGDPGTLTAFLAFCDKNYPADHNALIFWDHGAGPLIGYGQDELYDSDSLMLSEMIEAMDASPFSGQRSTSFWKKLSQKAPGAAENGRKLDFVGFDACLMSCLENMQVWSKYADYYVGSEELEPGDGWDYGFLKVLDEGTGAGASAAEEQQRVIPDGTSSTVDASAAQGQQEAPKAEQITSRILRTFKEYYDKKRSATSNPDLTLTCVDLTKIGNAVEALDKMARKMSSSVRGGDFSLLMKSRAQSKSFGLAKNAKGQVSYYFDLVDLWDLADQMKYMYPNEAEAVQKALDSAVIEHYTNIEHTKGISLYYPLRNKGQYSEMGKYYSDMLEKSGSAQAYGSFLITSNRRWMRSKARDWTLGEPVDNGNEYVLRMTQDQIDNSVGVYYTILQKDSLGGYTTRVKHCKIEPDKQGTVHLSKSLPLICARVGGYDYLLRVEQVEKDRKRSVYRTLNTALDSDVGYLRHREDIEEIPITIQFSINKKNEIQILSVTGDDSDIGLGGKTTVEIGNWEEMSTSTANEYAVPMRDSEGRILPFSEWNRPEVISWRDFPTDSTFELVMVNSGEMESDLVVQLEIEDINGEVYASELVPLSSSYESEQVRKAEVKTPRGVLTYSVYPDHAAVVEYSGTDEKIEIPDSVEGVPVTSIDAVFSTYTLYDSNGFNAVREIVLPDTVEKIGDMAFSTCMALETVRMPENLKYIGNAAFMHCQSLANIEIPDSVEEIGKCAFAYCSSLEEFRIPENLTRISDGVFMGCESLEQFTGASSTEACILVDGMLYTADGSELIACSASAGEEVGSGNNEGGEEDAPKYSCKVREGTRKIGYGAFADTFFTEVVLPDSLEEIGGYAFYGCDDLAVPQLPDGIAKVGCHAFDTEAYRFRNRTISSEQIVIRIPASLTDIGDHSFDKYINRRFEVDEENPHYMSVQGSLMNKAGDTCLQIASDENGTVIIPEGTVTYSEDLLTYYLNYRSTFGLSDSERHVYIPASVSRFEDVTVTSKNPESDDVMGWEYKSYLYHCQEGSAAEAYCIRKGLGYTNDMSMKTGETQVSTQKGTLYFDLYEDHAVLTAYDGEDEVLELPAEAGGKALTAVGDGREPVSSEWVIGASHECPNLRKLVIPEGVTEIRDRALNELSFDTEILLPDSLKKLGSFAIGTHVPVRLPEGLEELEEYCVRKVEGRSFVVRPALKKFDSRSLLNSDVQKLVQEGENAKYSVRDGILFNADGTEIVWYPFTTKSVVNVPEGVVKIGNGAFQKMENVKRIVLPASLRSIDYHAFYDCDRLEEIVFSPDTELDEIGEAAFEDCEALEKITLPPVGTIGTEAFLDCSKLGDVSFSEGTLNIGYRAFSWTAAADPVLPGSLQTIGSYAFEADERYVTEKRRGHSNSVACDADRGRRFQRHPICKLRGGCEEFDLLVGGRPASGQREEQADLLPAGEDRHGYGPGWGIVDPGVCLLLLSGGHGPGDPGQCELYRFGGD